MPTLEEKQAQVDALIAGGEKAQAVKLLFELIVEHAEAKRFDVATALRERLIALDDMALTEIIRSAEVIEAQQEQALDDNHLRIWSVLYDELSPEETNALFFALEEIRCEAGAVLMRQGAEADSLFFPDSGRFKLFFQKGDRYSLIQTVEPGSPVGQESLLSKSGFTVFLAAETASTARRLSAERFWGWKTEMPSLHGKLLTYCEKTYRLPDLLAQNQLDRRSAERVPLTGRVDVHVLDAQDQPAAKPFRGDMDNVSTGGLSFYIQSTAKAAHFLLGRTLHLSFGLPTAKGTVAAKGKARVVALKDRHFGNFTVHCRLLTPIPDRVIAAISLPP